MAEKTPSPAKSTVRQRKKSAFSSTQRFLPIAEIRNDVVLLKNGGLRAVLAIEALNFNLKSETEQAGIISGYESFMNTLNFPVQVVMRSTKMNIDPYIVSLRNLGAVQSNELLKKQTRSYADFVERLVDVAEIMQKEFYICIPYDQSTRRKTLIEKFLEWIHPDDTSSKAAARQREFAQGSRLLGERTNLVQTGLENIGLKSRRLTTHELVELYYETYNPKTSQEQKLPENLNTQEAVL